MMGKALRIVVAMVATLVCVPAVEAGSRRGGNVNVFAAGNRCNGGGSNVNVFAGRGRTRGGNVNVFAAGNGGGPKRGNNLQIGLINSNR